MVVDILLAILAVICIVIGILGSVLPVIPGPPIAYLGMWCAKWSGFADFAIVSNGEVLLTNGEVMVIWAVVTAFVTVIDYYLPAWFTKKFGGSKKAMWGATLGLIAAMILPLPIGKIAAIIVGPFIGAYIGQIIHDKTDQKKAWKAAFGAFLAFICGSGMKLVCSIWMAVLVVKALWPWGREVIEEATEIVAMLM